MLAIAEAATSWETETSWQATRGKLDLSLFRCQPYKASTPFQNVIVPFESCTIMASEASSEFGPFAKSFLHSFVFSDVEKCGYSASNRSEFIEEGTTGEERERGNPFQVVSRVRSTASWKFESSQLSATTLLIPDDSPFSID